MRLVPMALLVWASVAQAESAPKPPPPPSPYQLRLDLDLALMLGGVTLWGATSFIGSGSTPPPWCGSSTTPPCDRSAVNALDRAAIRPYDSTWRITADALTGVVPGLLTVLEIVDSGVTNWRGWLSDAVVISEAVVWTGAVQDITRRAVRRPRPWAYTSGLGNRDGVEAQFSFFSGHTSNVFAMATATAYTYSLRHPGSKWQWLVWSLAMAGATTEPITRVLSGDHFPTDCIAGALVGVSFGLLIPALHRRRLPVVPTATTAREGSLVGVAGHF